jgi:short subunit dehydrogenase-like uncharacterized protein
MNTTTNTTNKVILGVTGLVMAVSLMGLPLFASAATYAYVDTTGEVKPVVANTWQEAIAKAIGIHIHSGVLLLDSPSDFDIVGNEVSTY